MSRFSTIQNRFQVPTFERQQGESITYKITGQNDLTLTAVVIRGEQTEEKTPTGRHFEQLCTVHVKVSSDGTDGPTLAQLNDYREHSVVFDGKTYETVESTPPEIAGGMAMLFVSWMEDLKREKQGSVVSRRQRTRK